MSNEDSYAVLTDWLAKQIPRPVIRCVATSLNLVTAPKRHPELGWAEIDGVVLLFWGNGNNTLSTYQHILTDVESGTYGCPELVRAFAAQHAGRRPSEDLPFLGLAVSAEKLSLDNDADVAELMRDTPEQAQVRHADIVASGRGRQSIVVVGALVTGWQFEVAKPRHGDEQVKILAPGESWPKRHDLAVAVAEAVEVFQRHTS